MLVREVNLFAVFLRLGETQGSVTRGVSRSANVGSGAYVRYQETAVTSLLCHSVRKHALRTFSVSGEERGLLCRLYLSTCHSCRSEMPLTWLVLAKIHFLTLGRLGP